jgi:hypothetical protein
MKYKDVISGKTLDGNVYLDMHTGYDPIRGVFKRTFTVLPGAEKLVEINSYYWGVAEMGALSWVFFRDVDIVRHVRGGFHYFIIAANPRKILVPEDLIMEPKAIAKK